MAQRILKIAVRRAQQEERAVLSMKPSALCVKTTDTAKFDIPRHGIEGKTFEVMDFSTRYSMQNKQLSFDCSVSIVEYDEAIFEYDAVSEEQDLPAASVSLGRVDGNFPSEIEVNDLGASLQITWVNPDPSGKEVDETEIRYCYILNQETECQTVIETGSSTSRTVTLPSGASYSSVSLRSIFSDGSKSSWVSP